MMVMIKHIFVPRTRDTPGDVVRILKVHKTCINWLGKLLCPPHSLFLTMQNPTRQPSSIWPLPQVDSSLYLQSFWTLWWTHKVIPPNNHLNKVEWNMTNMSNCSQSASKCCHFSQRLLLKITRSKSSAKGSKYAPAMHLSNSPLSGDRLMDEFTSVQVIKLQI